MTLILDGDYEYCPPIVFDVKVVAEGDPKVYKRENESEVITMFKGSTTDYDINLVYLDNYFSGPALEYKVDRVEGKSTA